MIDLLSVFNEAYEFAAETPNREACGLITMKNGAPSLFRCRNVSEVDDQFKIHPEDYVAAKKLGIVAVFHSHIDGNPEPSMADRVGCEESRLPWLIIAVPNGTYKVFEPENFVAPLLGRPYVYGVFDCFSLCRDYYIEKGIIIPDHERPDGGWQNAVGMFSPENILKAGFHIVRDGSLKEGDGIIMQNGPTKKANHAGIYVGNGLMLHHAADQLSCRVPYHDYWVKVTNYVVRYGNE